MDKFLNICAKCLCKPSIKGTDYKKLVCKCTNIFPIVYFYNLRNDTILHRLTNWNKQNDRE